MTKDRHRAPEDEESTTGVRGLSGAFSRLDTLPEDVLHSFVNRVLRPGEVVGERFRLLEKIGAGAMGDVFVAENLAIGLRVALKLLKPDLLTDRDFRQRFQREAQAIAAVEHNYVARFYDVVIGNPTFIVMEFVRGEPLSALLRKEGQLAVDRAVALGAKIGWALVAAHAAGVIHRDLKPANVVIAPDLEQGEVPKVIDFGLAKLPLHGVETLTRAGQIIGTPAYMSPEQIEGPQIDARSDVYALGCLLFHMIAGRPPFVADTDMKVLYKQIHEEPLRLSALVPTVSPALDDALSRALAKKPEQRFPTMRAFLEALTPQRARGHALSSTTSAIEEQTGQVPPVRPRRARGLAAVSMAAAVLLAGGVGYRVAHRRRRVVAAPPRHVIVLSAPSDADIAVDGHPTGARTPAVIDDLPAGVHAFVLTRAGAELRREVSVSDGAPTVLEVAMPQVQRSVRVVTIPGEAAVWLDGQLVAGNTPLTIKVDRDDFHEVRVQKNGYETAVRAIRPEDPAELRVTLDPDREPVGWVIVDSNQADQVFIDGVFSGFTTPTLPMRVPVGAHEVSVQNASGAAARTRLEIRQGETQRLMLTAATPAHGTGR